MSVERHRGAINPRPPGQLSMLLTGIDQGSHFPEYKQNKHNARLGARKLLEADGKENKRAFPALHRLEKSELSRPRDRKVQRTRSAEQRILIYRINSLVIILTLKRTALDIQGCGNTNHTVHSKYSDQLSNTSSRSPRANTNTVITKLYRMIS